MMQPVTYDKSCGHRKLDLTPHSLHGNRCDAVVLHVQLTMRGIVWLLHCLLCVQCLCFNMAQPYVYLSFLYLCCIASSEAPPGPSCAVLQQTVGNCVHYGLEPVPLLAIFRGCWRLLQNCSQQHVWGWLVKLLVWFLPLVVT